MGGFKALVFVCSIILFAEVFGEEIYKMCAKQKDAPDCNEIGRSERLICKQHLHNVDCMLSIENGSTHFGRITPEEGLVGANFLKNVVVIGEFRLETAQNDDSEFGTVVLTRKSFGGGLKNLRNKKYCHPGFKFDYGGDYMWKEFENVVLKENNAETCSKTVESKTLFEKEIKAVSEFFGPSCRAGPWIGFDEYDSLYNRYSKLCELCPNKNCKDIPNTLTYSIECLVNGGDVAVTTLHMAQEYFNKSENTNKIQEYGYLCTNGDVVGLDRPCIWSKQPWNIIIASRNSEAAIRKSLQEWFSKYTIGTTSSRDSDEQFVYPLKKVLFPVEAGTKIKFYETAPSLLDYLRGYRTVPTPIEKCNENVRWCTVSQAEQQKCLWLSQAAANIALQPTIKCIQSHNKFACLEDIKTDLVDLVAADAHFGYISRKKNLAPLAYPDTDASNRIKPVIVIKGSDTTITKLEDLKTKKACFPEYGGIEWLAFINLTRDRGILSKASCDYGKLITDFVGDSCMPGAHDREHEATIEIDKDKLCKLCQPHPYESKTEINCNSNSENRFYGNAGALNCLKEVGDFAVVSAGDYTDSSDFKVLCRNGSVASYAGLNVDDNCVLTIIVDSEVLSKKNSPKNSDLQVILLHLESRFGFYSNKPFEVFNIFNNTMDLLFKDSTRGLTRVDSDKRHIKNFVNLLSDHEKCVEIKGNNTAIQLQVTLPIVLTSLTILTVLK
ncbi:hypothetical protein RN001_004613 [Aquatica leii]|uniref:Transferrin-like domain-containing protein n=1 Tax=Aquatica leii TaxID=1421715 RepID=A0AAN7SI42_9COLE|nr:hypothetical protein RN001_004613 [Aquatica leii]